jgi:hypothetical protein
VRSTDELLAFLEEARGELAGSVVDHVCVECDRTVTTPAAWAERPVCCGWEMVDLPGTIRAATSATSPTPSDEPPTLEQLREAAAEQDRRIEALPPLPPRLLGVRARRVQP